MSYRISQDCIGCGTCARKCPDEAIEGEIKVRFDIDPYLCRECGTCFETCRQGAIIDPQGNRSPRKAKGKAPTKAHIETTVCAGCLTCLLNCPQEAIHEVKKGFFFASHCSVEDRDCVGCGNCLQFCITGAITLS